MNKDQVIEALKENSDNARVAILNGDKVVLNTQVSLQNGLYTIRLRGKGIRPVEVNVAIFDDIV